MGLAVVASVLFAVYTIVQIQAEKKLVSKGIATRSKKLLGAPSIATTIKLLKKKGLDWGVGMRKRSGGMRVIDVKDPGVVVFGVFGRAKRHPAWWTRLGVPGFGLLLDGRFAPLLAG